MGARLWLSMARMETNKQLENIGPILYIYIYITSLLPGKHISDCLFTGSNVFTKQFWSFNADEVEPTFLSNHTS